MSTELYLRCDGHQPPITSTAQCGTLYRIDRLRRDIRDAPVILAALAVLASHELLYVYDIGDDDRQHTLRFLAEHPHCQIAIIDEYGHDHPLDGGAA